MTTPVDLMSVESREAALFACSDNAEVKVTHIGRRASAVIRIDNVLRDAGAVAALGFAQTYSADRSNLYPGVRASMPASFSAALRAWLTPVLRRCGVLQDDEVIFRDSSFFSVVTTPARDLLPIQRIPHYDSTDPSQLAAVIYLCDSRFSGTSFYRHRKTGYEEITEENRSNYELALNHDMRIHGAPPREYTNGDGLLFETVFSNELRFNSAVIYPGRILHAANIEKNFQPPQDKKDWRLTITTLLHCGSALRSSQAAADRAAV